MKNENEETLNVNAVAVNRLGDDSLQGALRRQWGASPWYVGSFGLHMVVFAILLLFAPEPVMKQTRKIRPEVTTIDDTEEPSPDDVKDIEPKDDDQLPDDDETPVPDPINSIDTPEITDPVLDSNEPVDDPAPSDSSEFATEDASNEPITIDATATYTGGARGCGPFSTRRGPARTHIVDMMHPAQVNAVKQGLAWLAKVQEEDGHWNSSKYGGKGHDAAVTSLAMLAFLGDGNSSKAGKYKKTVRAGQDWLARRYNAATRMIGSYQYEAAVTMMATAEAWAMSGDKTLAPIVQGQVDLAVEKQSATGGWGYTPVRDHTAAHVDTSVAGWWVMALKSAKVAGAEIKEDCWKRATGYFEHAARAEQGGYVSGYNQPLGDMGKKENLTAVSLACLQFLGSERQDKFVKGQAESLLKRNWIMGMKDGYDGVSKGGKTNYYGWYYQALGLFQYGTRSAEWKTLESGMRRILVDLQVKQGFNKGSWDYENGKDDWGYEQAIGRVGVTATACLILEVYYRFANVHDSKR